MKPATEPEVEFESLKCLLLDMAQERSLDALLNLIVNRLVERPHMALVRIWLARPGDICASCRMREECPDQTSCLHLVASAGNPLAESGADWSRLDGDFRRFPFGVRKVGHIAATGEPVEITDVRKDSKWLARPDWAEREGIQGFGGQPLLFKGEVLGVIAVFTRILFVHEGFIWLRMIADHAAASIANARAFEEIERLQKQLELENAYLKKEVSEAKAFGDIIGESPALRQVLDQIELVAPTDARVLILGESGTGKELVAREIHKRSPRRDRPLITVNCASIPKYLYESEFFGHVKGAFTGAVKDRTGRFELADEGTLFLDEVGEIPLELQSKLLRVLQEGQFERVGEEKTRKVNVRIIAATNRDLKEEVAAGRFRQDLYYRLNVFPVEVVPLRGRTEDIPLLAAQFLELAATKLNLARPRLTQANLLRLQAYDWPGNVRELQNVIERAVIVSQSGVLRFDLPQDTIPQRPAARKQSKIEANEEVEVTPEDEMRRRERENLLNALRQTGWKIYGAGGAAELLGINPTTLSSRIKKLGLKKSDY
ncbi:MAG: sigma 54-interacting transcriptional regulator [Planctomycetota bacterium]|nr:sigma 54-interacting transcriptional regulator [Planctomycetota bacterium]